MKVENLINAKGNKVANQFIVYHKTEGGLFESHFISYETEIAIMRADGKIELNDMAFEYSATTSRHTKTFLIDYCGLTAEEVDIIKKVELGKKSIEVFDDYEKLRERVFFTF